MRDVKPRISASHLLPVGRNLALGLGLEPRHVFVELDDLAIVPRGAYIGVPAQRIGEIVAGKRNITADTDLRLCRFFGLSNGYWLRAQVAHDTEVAQRALGAKLGKITPWSNTTAYGNRASTRA